MPLSEYRHIISRSPWRYQSIVTLSAQSPRHYQTIVTSCEISIPLSECRHIISSLHATIRVSSHYHQSPCYYQSVVTLSSKSPCHYQRTVTSSEVSMSLPEYRYIISSFSMSLSWYCHIISRLHVFIRVSTRYQIIYIFIIITVQWSFYIYTIIFFYSSLCTLHPSFSPPTCT